MDFSLVKRHPYVSGATIVIGVIIVYLIMKRRAGSGGSAASPGMTDNSLTALNSGTALQSAAINAGIETSQLQGQVASNQIAAELEAVKVQQQTALAIVGKQEDTKLAIASNTNDDSLAATAINANAAIQIQTTQANAALGIANIGRDVAINQQNNLRNVALTLGTQKELGSKITGVLAALQGPQAIAANQPTQVAQINKDASTGPLAFVKALNPVSLLSSFFG